jgi:hypothetical protein
MNKRFAVLIAGVALAAGFGAFALDALKPGEEEPAGFVLARKAAMQSNAANFAEIRAKAKAGDIKAIAVNARSMAVMDCFVPLAFGDTYMADYPEGYNYFFKGGDPADIQAKAQDLVSAVEALAGVAEAGDRAGVDAKIAAVLPSCGACHTLYRGQK